jgi:signal peptidase
MAARASGTAVLLAARRSVLAAATGLVLCSVVPAAFGWTTAVVTSGSMQPSVRTGDVVAASPVAPGAAGTLPRGTVILFKDPADPGKLLLHRLVGFTPDGKLITKGDANAVTDSSPVPVEYLKGRARLRIPGLGLPVVWIQYGRYVPVIALGFLIAVTLLWRPRTAQTRP